MATKRKSINIFQDSSSSLELDAFKQKIKKLYDEILERTYKIENPGASPEEVQAYVEENGLEFPDEDTTEEDSNEVDNLMEMLDGMSESDVQESIDDLSTEDKPKEHKGTEPSSKSHELPLATSLGCVCRRYLLHGFIDLLVCRFDSGLRHGA